MTLLGFMGLYLILGVAAGGIVSAINHNTAALNRIHDRLGRLPQNGNDQ